MNPAPLKAGDRVDYHELRDGEVTRVGRATLWAVFSTPHGNMPIAGPIGDFQRPRPPVPPAARVGDFTIFRNDRTHKIVMVDHRTGEAGDFEEAKLESWLRKFWTREF